MKSFLSLETTGGQISYNTGIDVFENLFKKKNDLCDGAMRMWEG